MAQVVKCCVLWYLRYSCMIPTLLGCYSWYNCPYYLQVSVYRIESYDCIQHDTHGTNNIPEDPNLEVYFHSGYVCTVWVGCLCISAILVCTSVETTVPLDLVANCFRRMLFHCYLKMFFP